MIADRQAIIRWLTDQPDGVYEAKPHKAKRSLSANSYYWTLVTELAGHYRISRAEAHDMMLRRYGQYLTDLDGNLICVRVEPKTNMTAFEGHYEYDGNVDGMAVYRVIRGSHTYDSLEFSRLLDGLISDCQDAGIETLTPAEIQRLQGYAQAHKSITDTVKG